MDKNKMDLVELFNLAEKKAKQVRNPAEWRRKDMQDHYKECENHNLKTIGKVNRSLECPRLSV